MPTYEYACKSCGEHLEVVQSFNDDPLTTCPNCGGQLRKVFGSIGIAFKGSGFYRTDSRPAPKEKAEPASSESGTKAEKKAEKVEKKAEAKGGSTGDSKAAASS